nr:MAG TPA: hypothetical protein [Caudoviricetes sp.]
MEQVYLLKREMGAKMCLGSTKTIKRKRILQGDSTHSHICAQRSMRTEKKL